VYLELQLKKTRHFALKREPATGETGLIRSCLYISDVSPDDRYLVVIGFGESLCNIAWALVLIMVAMIITTVGTWRISRRPAEIK
jgi:hypothetical protein